MTPAEAVLTCLVRKFADFKGRASRAEYWWFFLFAIMVTLATETSGIRAMTFVVGVVLFVPRLAVTVRRLHDTGRAGWWALLSLVGWVPGLLPLGWVVLLWFMIQKGEQRDNRYGPNPDPDLVLGVIRPESAPPPPAGR